ncbi:MAG TPA: PIG-L family deacetylase [Thermomicrobiales bacterium]|nr:PIG-L family deacetylase [Thermomicrobiales bacterium]
MSDRSLLAVFAHPDDESICAGTLARYAAGGCRVVLVCATRGEVGEISDPALATPETLPAVREGELRCATRAMGIGEPIFLGYRDSGMDGTDDNRHPDAFVNADPAEVVSRLVRIIREVRPQVVITFDETGGYGHPDHIAVWRHTHAAVEAAATCDDDPDAGEPWQVERIAYAVFAKRFFTELRELLVSHGEDTSELDEFAELGLGFPDDRIHAVVDVSAFLDQKAAAFECHRTQFGGDTFFSRVSEDETRQMRSREYFSFGWPAGIAGQMEDDLFPA